MKHCLYRCLAAALLAGVLLVCAACGAEEPVAPENSEPSVEEQTQPEQTLPEQETSPAPE